jgi:siroheme synthase
MTNIEKIKRVVLIASGFGLATYLTMSGMAILDKDERLTNDLNTTSEVHSNTVK